MSRNFTSNDAVNANANEKVTISLYSKEYSKDSKQYKEGTKYNRACFEELENVIRISEGLSNEAKSQEKVPPEVEVLFLLIPSEDKINKASSLIMKISVDNNFMKWLINKK